LTELTVVSEGASKRSVSVEDSILVDNNQTKALTVGLLAWMVPGGGHFWQGRYVRGLILGGAVCAMFALGLYWGGHLYGLHNYGEMGPLAYVFGLCNLGNGLLYVFCLMADIGLLNKAYLATAEYGDRFLMVAGLLNYLAMLDAYDVARGRKV